MKRRTSRPFWFTLAAAAAALIAFLAVVQWREFDQAAAAREALDRSHAARADLLEVQTLAIDLETGQRGYVVTGDPEFLEPYQRARSRIRIILGRLEARSGNDAVSREALARLGALVARKIELSDSIIAARRSEGAQAAAQIIALGEGKYVMDSLRGLVSSMEQAESARLRANADRATAVRANIRKLTIGIELLLLLLTVVTAWLLLRSRRAAEAYAARLRDLSKRQQAIFDAANDAILIFDRGGRIESHNPAASALYGHPHGLVGKTIAELFEISPDPELLDAALSQLAERAEGPEARVDQLLACRPDGTRFWTDVTTSSVRLAEGVRFVSIIRDATERRRVAEMKTEFVATVSHELRTPLTSIAGSLGLLRGGAGGALPDKALRLIQIAHDNSERLVRLINDILDIEKIESGKLALEVEPLQLAELIEEAVHANLAYAEAHEVTIRTLPIPPAARILADRDRLMQVLANLISNAAKFSEAGGEIEIEARPGPLGYRILVKDRGSGIPEAFRTQMFTKFAQADSSDTRQKGGTGLGLSIAREIMLRMNGDIGFAAREGGGTIFHIDLPVPVDGAAAGAPQPVAPRLLLACGDAGDALRAAFARGGYDCDFASTLEAAARLAERQDYAAILIDLPLLAEDPVRMVERLRGLPRHDATPVLVVSARDLETELERLEPGSGLASLENLLQPAIRRRSGGGRASILHIEDDADVIGIVGDAFGGRVDLHAVADVPSARAVLKERAFDLVILDIGLPGPSGLDLLPELRDRNGRAVPVVIFSARDEDPEIAGQVAAMLTKSRASLDDLVAAVDKLLGQGAGA